MEQKKQADLQMAILAAQRAVHAVSKDSRNAHQNYDYASAEAILTEARRCLLDAGLVARRGAWTYVEGAEPKVLMTFHLAHPESGDSVTEQIEWPAVPGKGRPTDKALAAALTSAWSYWLRDLLLIPRASEEMDKRDDHDYAPPSRQRAQSQPAAPAKQQRSPEQQKMVDEAKALVDRVRQEPAAGVASHEARKKIAAAEWPDKHKAKAIASLDKIDAEMMSDDFAFDEGEAA